MEKYLKAVATGDSATADQEMKRLARHLERIPENDTCKPGLREILNGIQGQAGNAVTPPINPILPAV